MKTENQDLEKLMGGTLTDAFEILDHWMHADCQTFCDLDMFCASPHGL